jgi:methionine synthase I (cobalamin-dependent)
MKSDVLPNLQEALVGRIIVGDGAMGTYLYQLGFPIGVSYEEFNLLKPDIIKDVHRLYYEAGARLIETNTFSANREKLSRYGLENEVVAINQAGVQLARQAVGSDAYVFGAVGSIRTGRRSSLSSTEVEFDLQQQIEALLDAGADGIILETFSDMSEMNLALKLVRKLSERPVICQFATEDSGLTRDGVLFSEAFQQLQADGASVIGFNCHSGPNGILRALEKMVPLVKGPYSVFSNA